MNSLDYYVLDKVNNGVIVIDQKLNIVIWNAWMERLTGRTKKETIGRKLPDICPRFAEKTYADILLQALNSGQSRFCSASLHKVFVYPIDKNYHNNQQNMQVEPIRVNDECYAMVQITDITGHYKRIKHLRNMVKEVTMEYNQIKISERISKHQALHDGLTGLPNRNLLYERLLQGITYARRNKQMLAVMFMDLDGFKEVNDFYGHLNGDLLLQMVVARLKLYIRETDTLARFGGDEFVLLLSQLKGRQDAVTVAEKIIDTFKEPFCVEDISAYITVSIGISVFPDDSENIEGLLKMADLTMYQVKICGGNAFRFSTSES